MLSYYNTVREKRKRKNNIKKEIKTIKTYNNIFNDICSTENLIRAHKNARRDKSYYSSVQKTNRYLNERVSEINLLLFTETYKPGTYSTEIISDRGKRRVLYKLPYFPDRIIQWAILQQTEKIFQEVLLPFSCASLPGKGIHYATKLLRTYLAEDSENTQFCYKFDIKKFYANIDHEILKKLLAKKIRDKKLLRLLAKIIDSKNTVDLNDLILTSEEREIYSQYGKGVPVGSYLSQYLANFYLAYFDHFLKEELHCKYVIRYMDDIIILDGSKDFLHSLREPIEKYLKQELNLEIKSNWQIYPVDARGIDFVGYRHFHGYTLVRKKTARHFIKETNKINICGNQRIYPTEQQYHFWISSSGWIAWANAYNLIKKYYIQPGIISVNQFYQVYIASKVKYKKGKRRKSFNKNRLIKQMKQHKIFKYKYYNSHKHLHYNKKGVFI